MHGSHGTFAKYVIISFVGGDHVRHGYLTTYVLIVIIKPYRMRPLKTLSLLSISPVYCSACRNGPLFAQQALRLQCLPPSISNGYSILSPKRLSSTSAPDPSFVYRIGASFSAKGHRFRPKEDTFSFDPAEDNDVYTGRPNSGQDAFFVSNAGPADKHGRRRKIAFGVADGVGGWADSGIDSADFSHGLCHAMNYMARDAFTLDTSNDPQDLLEQAYDEIVREGKIAGGGSTACVAIGDEDGSLSVAK